MPQTCPTCSEDTPSPSSDYGDIFDDIYSFWLELFNHEGAGDQVEDAAPRATLSRAFELSSGGVQESGVAVGRANEGTVTQQEHSVLVEPRDDSVVTATMSPETFDPSVSLALVSTVVMQKLGLV